MAAWIRLVPLACVIASACAGSRGPDAQQIDELVDECRRNPARASKLRRSKSVGFRAHRRGGPRKVVMFGAPWCEPCDAAELFLSRRGIPFEHKDIESSALVKAEMNATLKDAGLESGGLPVLDIDGVVTRGFLPCVVDEAWAR